MSGPDPKASERQPSPIPAALTALRAYRVGEVLTLHEDGPRSRERGIRPAPGSPSSPPSNAGTGGSHEARP